MNGSGQKTGEKGKYHAEMLPSGLMCRFTLLTLGGRLPSVNLETD